MPPADPATLRANAQAAAAALRSGDARKAGDLLEGLVAAEPSNVSFWLGLALAKRNLGEGAASGAAIDRALSLEPRNCRGLILKADHLAAEGLHRNAARFYAAALRAAPPQPPADLAADLARAQNALARDAADYEAYLRAGLEARGAPLTQGRFGQSLDILTGRKQIFLQQPRTYYFPELPQKQFYERAAFPWMDGVEAATSEVRGELLQVLAEEGAFTPYVEDNPNLPRSPGNDLIGSPEWSAFFLWKTGAAIEEHVARCPKTMSALDGAPLARIRNASPSVLYSLLRPGAHIPAHTGYLNTRLICHLPLTVPEGCRFRVGNDVRTWEEGKCWAFDDTIEHEAWNTGGKLRVVLIFDVWRPELSEEERGMVQALFDTIDAYGGAEPMDI